MKLEITELNLGDTLACDLSTDSECGQIDLRFDHEEEGTVGWLTIQENEDGTLRLSVYDCETWWKRREGPAPYEITVDLLRQSPHPLEVMMHPTPVCDDRKIALATPLPCTVYDDATGRACGKPSFVADAIQTAAEPDEPTAGWLIQPICNTCLAVQKAASIRTE